MTKLSRKPMSDDKMGYLINNLWSVLLSVKSREEMKVLFRDLFTHTEYKMLAKRLEIARRLLDGEAYEEISKQINVSEQTISNVSNTLAQQGNGFRKAYKDLKSIEERFAKNRKHINLRRFPRYKGTPHLAELIKG